MSSSDEEVVCIVEEEDENSSNDPVQSSQEEEEEEEEVICIEDDLPQYDYCQLPTTSAIGDFHCQFCKWRGPAFASLRAHVTFAHPGKWNRKQKHANEKHFACKLCSFRTSRQSNLKSHVMIIHPGRLGSTGDACKTEKGKDRLLHPCEYCDWSGKTYRALSCHFWRKHPGKWVGKPSHLTKSYHCTDCGRHFKDITEFTTHQKTLTCSEQKFYSCKFCSYRGALPINLATHVKSKHREHCILSTIEIATRHEIKDLKLKKTRARTRGYNSSNIAKVSYKPKKLPSILDSCPYCNWSGDSYRRLISHIVSNHGGKWIPKKPNFYKPYRCTDCGKNVKNRLTLTAHQRTHTGELPFSCNYCSYRASYSTTLKWHVKSKHPEHYVPPKKGVATRHSLRVEKLKHGTENKGKKRKRSSNNDHSQDHSQEDCVILDQSKRSKALKTKAKRCINNQSRSSVQCDDRNSNNLECKLEESNDSQEDSSDSIEHCCSYCDWKSTSYHSLRSHVKAKHPGKWVCLEPNLKKPFQCMMCGKRFAKADRLVVHRRMHTGERPFVCNWCFCCFIDLSSLRSHVKSKHPEHYIPMPRKKRLKATGLQA